MSVIIQEDQRGKVVVLMMGGKLMCGPDVAVLHDAIKKWIQAGIVRVVVDFSNVQWFGSSMLGVLAASYTSLKQVQGGIVLTGVSEKITAILAVSRLTEIFDIKDSIDLAVDSF